MRRRLRSAGSLSAIVLATFAAVLVPACEDDPAVPSITFDASIGLDGARPDGTAPSGTDASRPDGALRDGNTTDAPIGDARAPDADADLADTGVPDADGGAPDTSVPADGGADADGGVVPDSGPDVDAGPTACNAPPYTATDQPLVAAPLALAPTPAGGAIEPGIYDLAPSTKYTGTADAGTTVETLKGVTLRFNADGTYQSADADPAGNGGGTWSTTGTSLSLQINCPVVLQNPIVRPYTQAPGVLSIFFQQGPDLLEHRYVKR